MLDKSKARFRIDPAAAMIISHTLARIDNGEIDINQHILSEGFGFQKGGNYGDKESE